MITLYQVDAFAEKVFTGNPAGVCILEHWLEDKLMQNIAAENNLAETAFAVKNPDGYDIRWFTPMVEVDLCGHATMATAHVIFNYYDHPTDIIKFQSRNSGSLEVAKNHDQLTLNFPVDELHEIEPLPEFKKWLGKTPLAFKGKSDYLLVLDSQQEVIDVVLNKELMSTVDARGFIVTAPGDSTDFVSRWFGPLVGVDEDPVTGSAHTTLTPYWAKRLGKTDLSARQLSKRGGSLQCKLDGDRVYMSGKAITYLKGEIYV
ncbi:PhzF family phenazine biosynthesis protein [Fulvivirga ligni]|uniref:PhzF family phenazine biosynthesis protein n=1 Tax=Fulvivirga ligni TaxID=2904246 RepID=UPI001F31F8C1|nr:PhzF family phenazine biosynthesis protein [Fulvivirga ligni]UII21027.1 PhzF family phenazine biosynthesis protein [Fulvivirga ligni]